MFKFSITFMICHHHHYSKVKHLDFFIETLANLERLTKEHVIIIDICIEKVFRNIPRHY